MPQSIASYLKKGSKVKVRKRLNTWATFDHSKVIIIDRDLAYTGGMNFGEEYRYQWHDMMVALRGPVTGRLVKNFYETWSFNGWGGDFSAAYRKLFSKKIREENLEKSGMINIRLLYTRPDEAQIFKAQIEAIKRAQKRIYIQNAYFSDDRIVKGLIEARARGVDVRVILPSENDISIMQKNNIVMASFLAVCSMVSCNFSCTGFGKRSISPITRKRTLFFMKISSSREVSTSPIRAATSSAGRFQFSVEKV